MQLESESSINKAQRQLRPEPYFPEFFKSRALESSGDINIEIGSELSCKNKQQCL